MLCHRLGWSDLLFGGVRSCFPFLSYHIGYGVWCTVYTLGRQADRQAMHLQDFCVGEICKSSHFLSLGYTIGNGNKYACRNGDGRWWWCFGRIWRMGRMARIWDDLILGLLCLCIGRVGMLSVCIDGSVPTYLCNDCVWVVDNTDELEHVVRKWGVTILWFFVMFSWVHVRSL